MTNDSTSLARSVLDALIGAGLEHVVLCPGSRNAPLAFAVDAAARAGRITLHTRLDERTAGFLALGMAKATHLPAAVITTSGTAAANLHPAVLEAAHAGMPLVVVTADRPASLRGTMSNQTTDQVRLFGEAARFADLTDAGSAVIGIDHAGPTHLNVQLTDPLTPEADSPAYVPTRRGAVPPHLREVDRDELPLGPRTVVVAGDDAGPPARVLAEQANWPLLAEPTSGARTGANALRTYRLLLGTGLADRIERVVVFGHPTLSRPVSRLLARADVEVVSVRPGKGRWRERPHPVTSEHDGVSAQPGDHGWLEEWRTADAECSRSLDRFVAERPDLTPHEVAGAVSATVPPKGLLYVGASNPIRDLDLMARAYPVGERRKVIANRGLAGIDGVVSSAIGAALARTQGRSLALLGDVTFLHDMTALVIGPAEARPDLTIVVANDDGGSIFATLEQGAPAHASSYDKLFGTPHGVDVAALCAATRTAHVRVTSRGELEHVLASPNGGIEVIEAVCRRDDRRELDEAIRGLA